MKSLLIIFATVLSFNCAWAVDVAGVKFGDNATVGGGTLVVNGAGLRKKAFFKVYAMALYLPEKQGDVLAVLGSKGAKRIGMSLLRDLSAQQLVDALHEGFADNLAAAEMTALAPRIKAFAALMLTLGEAKSGTLILIDSIPDIGTRLTVNGQVVGTEIRGDDFYPALLKIWLGNKPIEHDLKQALLGQPS